MGCTLVERVMTTTPRWASFAVAAVLAAACGGADDPETAAGPADEEEVAATTVEVEAAGEGAPAGGMAGMSTAVPDVLVVDVPTGEPTELRSLVDPDRPTLLWMWAPH